jgi:hypothetical protein
MAAISRGHDQQVEFPPAAKRKHGGESEGWTVLYPFVYRCKAFDGLREILLPGRPPGAPDDAD